MAEEFLTEEDQLEEIKRWTAQNGAWLLAGVLIALAIVFGYRYYESSRNEQRYKAAAQFDALAAAIDHNDRAGAQRIGESIIKDYDSTPYADQARLSLARLSVDAGKLGDAMGPLTQVMNGSKDKELRNIARLRLARIQIDIGKPDEAIGTLAAGEPGAFAPRYHEVRGDALLAKKDAAGALAEYKSALAAGDPRSVDTQVLELKINDLGAAAAAPTAKVAP